MGRFNGGEAHLSSGETFVLTTRPVVGDDFHASVQVPNLYKDVKKGDRILAADGALQLRVTEVEGRDIITRVMVGGAVKDHSGLNLPGVRLSAASITETLSTFACPAWASLRGVEINGQTQEARPDRGYVSLRRRWLAGDRVDVHFDLPLRVVLDNGQGPTPLAQGKVSLDVAPPTLARSIVICRGPAILAQFRLQHGCEFDLGVYRRQPAHVRDRRFRRR